MERKEYSAGAVKVCFWFSEFRKVVTLLSEGNSMENIKSRKTFSLLPLLFAPIKYSAQFLLV